MQYILEIKVSGVHRLRANCAQNYHQGLVDTGLTDRADGGFPEVGA